MSRLLVIAGERSSDAHAGRVIHALRAIAQDCEVYGIGGDALAREGMHIMHHTNEMAVMGFGEIIRHLPRLLSIKKEIIDTLDSCRPDAVILVDYPGFNLKIARAAGERNIPVIYYIAPQAWAWGKKRVKILEKYVTKLAVIFQFERDFFADHGVTSEFVGHPLVESWNEEKLPSREEFFSTHGLNLSKGLVAFLPGSRVQELRRHLPLLNETARILHKRGDCQIICSRIPTLDEAWYRTAGLTEPNIIFTSATRALLSYATAGVVKSGTSTLEAVIAGMPMVLIYKTSPLTYELAKRLVKLKTIGLVNIVAGEKIVKELVQHDAQPEYVAGEIAKLLDDDEYRGTMKSNLARVREKLGGVGASKRVAEIVANYLRV